MSPDEFVNALLMRLAQTRHFEIDGFGNFEMNVFDLPLAERIDKAKQLVLALSPRERREVEESMERIERATIAVRAEMMANAMRAN